MEYLVPRLAPDGRLVFVAQSRESDPPQGDDYDYPTIFRADNRVVAPAQNQEVRAEEEIADKLLKFVRGLRDR